MFKKIYLSFILASLPMFGLSAYAVQFDGLSEIRFKQSDNQVPFYELGIEADSDGEITKEHGIIIMIDKGRALQWDQENNNNIVVGGSAADKIVTPVKPVISEDLYRLSIAVKEDFKKGDRITLQGLTPISFNEEEVGLLRLDVNNDGLSDADNLYQYRVKNEVRTDFNLPDTPMEVSAVYDKVNKWVKLTWKNPQNYDYVRTVVAKRLGDADIEAYSGTSEEAYDNKVFDGQNITYEFFSNDKNGNISKKTSVSLVIGEEPKVEDNKEEVVPEPEEEKQQEEVTQEETSEESTNNTEEKKELNRFLNYYNIRYQIKCLREGVNPKDSVCLWAKINLIYAQKMLDKSSTAELTSEDLRLMKLRIRWPEARYKTNCTEADKPADYCPALNDSIKRVHYFID